MLAHVNECAEESSGKEIKAKISKRRISTGNFSAYKGECNIL